MNQYEIVYYLSIAAAFYTAWTIGANDVANAFATSVGSKALTIKKAIIAAAIFEFSGSVLVGVHVTETIRSKIINIELFSGKEWTFALGMLAALISTGIWLQIATMLGMPVSTTHSIVGSIFGFGLISVGFSGIDWTVIIKITLSWIISPLIGFIFAFLIFIFIRAVIIDQKHPLNQLKKWAPIFIFICVSIISFSFLYKGLKNLHLNLPLWKALLFSSLIGFIASLIFGIFYLSRFFKGDRKPISEQYISMEKVFKYLQIMTACYMAFAHGANDVANSVGPLSGIIIALKNKNLSEKAEVPLYILCLGGIGIVIGLITYGYKVILTVGKKITELTPSRGFAAEFSTATVVLLFSKLSIPMSTTHTIVGSVIGVGFARGISALNLNIIKDIINSWIWTVPLNAILTILIYEILIQIF